MGGRAAQIVDRRGSDSHPIVRFDLVADRNAAEALRGYDVEVPASALPPPEPDADEYAHVDLIGCRVTSGERLLGTVSDVLVYPANDVLEVRSTTRLTRCSSRSPPTSSRRSTSPAA